MCADRQARPGPACHRPGPGPARAGPARDRRTDPGRLARRGPLVGAAGRSGAAVLGKSTVASRAGAAAPLLAAEERYATALWAAAGLQQTVLRLADRRDRAGKPGQGADQREAVDPPACPRGGARGQQVRGGAQRGAAGGRRRDAPPGGAGRAAETVGGLLQFGAAGGLRGGGEDVGGGPGNVGGCRGGGGGAELAGRVGGYRRGVAEDVPRCRRRRRRRGRAGCRDGLPASGGAALRGSAARPAVWPPYQTCWPSQWVMPGRLTAYPVTCAGWVGL